ncbi:unnamed protein product [Danaus chrysippus]|uniref:(African queen) hypothetical protein n=1 Tax=Danaus chrysippus TaxID=151541 RepID=A0A8J2R228_9NEOP|nr:unnamed protein product [Danaus chrysippus]
MMDQIEKIAKLVGDIIQDTNWRISILDTMQKENSDNVHFEVGYLTQIIQDRYRRMVDFYTTCRDNMKKFYIMEHIIYLHDVEYIYWEITHITNMLHEIERKYNYVDTTTYKYDWDRTDYGNMTETSKDKEEDIHVSIFTKAKKKSRFVMDRYIKEGWWSTKRIKKKNPWPLDYGWDQVSDLSNTLKILHPQDSIINELSWGTKIRILKKYPQKPERRVGLSYLRTAEDTTIHSMSTKSLMSPIKNEDSSMKMKLFRLMYEAVRDSELKVKRAELIRSYYSNYSTFEIGFLIGDITDKYNIMTDISLTLKKLYKEWKPMEHINAYEQIANKVTPSIICQRHYDHLEDRAASTDKERVKEFIRVLLVESKFKINQIDFIRNMFANTAGFQVGTIIGTIREKYKTMLIVYKQKENKFLKKADLKLPRVNVRRPLHYYLRLVDYHQ